MSYFLAFDTSQTEGSVALAKDDEIVVSFVWMSQKNHSALLANHLEEVLKLLPSSYKSVDALALFKGPGSSTGLRISHALAKGLNFYSQKPLYLFSSQEVEACKKKYKEEFKSLSLLLVKMAYDSFVKASTTSNTDEMMPEYFLKNP